MVISISPHCLEPMRAETGEYSQTSVKYFPLDEIVKLCFTTFLNKTSGGTIFGSFSCKKAINEVNQISEKSNLFL
jgi:hypothetical protein